jgi:SanA protein
MLARAVRALVALILIAALSVILAWVEMEREVSARVHQTLETLEPAKAGLVLGSSRLLRGGYPNPYFDNRIAAAALLFGSGRVDYLIVSVNQARGGRAAGGYDEPSDKRDALVEAGVPANRIYRDYAGFRTLDSVLRAKTIFGQDRVIVVSQRFHNVRALFLAEHNGLIFDAYDAADVPLRFDVTTKVREALARVWAFVDVLDGRAARFGGAEVKLGVDPPT